MAKAKRKANGYKFPDPLPKGEVLEDIAKKKWKLGASIGQGGFGEIYSAQEVSVGGAKYPFVIKIEPHENGPLFVERKFYVTNAKSADVEVFKIEKGLKTFGMPVYIGSGTHTYKDEKYRFLVMEKFGMDLWKIFVDNNRIFPSTTVFKLAVQILDVLEYIHKCGYVHADIKASNILLGSAKDSQNKQIYLVDFGLATRFTDDTEFKPNPKKAHDGTIEYLSRDAHQGVQTRRGDLEILAYNLIQWLGCKLPWENLKNPKDVQQSKEQHMKDVPKFIRTCFEQRSPPGPLVDFLNFLKTLKFNTEPDYAHLRQIFISGVDSKDSLSKPFQFSMPTKKSPQRTPKRKNRANSEPSPKRKVAKGKKPNVQESEDEKENLDDIEETELPEKISSKRKNNQKAVPSSKRKNVKGKKPEEVSDGTVVSDEEEELDESLEGTSKAPRGRPRKKINYNEQSDTENKRDAKRKLEKTAPKDIHVTADNLDGYTEAMKEIVRKKQRGNKKMPQNETDTTMEGYTEAMKEIAGKKIKGRNAAKGDSMEGYTDEMREIANKRRGAKKKTEPVASTSKIVRNKNVNSGRYNHNGSGDMSDSD